MKETFEIVLTTKDKTEVVIPKMETLDEADTKGRELLKNDIYVYMTVYKVQREEVFTLNKPKK